MVVATPQDHGWVMVVATLLAEWHAALGPGTDAGRSNPPATHGAEAGHRATHRVSGSTETKTYGKSATAG